MSTGFFGDIQKVKYEGPDSTNPLAYRFYNPDEIVAGKRLEDHLRFAAPTGTPLPGRAAIRSAARLSIGRGSPKPVAPTLWNWQN